MGIGDVLNFADLRSLNARFLPVSTTTRVFFLKSLRSQISFNTVTSIAIISALIITLSIYVYEKLYIEFVSTEVNAIGENISVRRIQVLSAEAGVVDSYVHSNNRIAVLVALKGGDAELARDVAMHVAAVNPMVISGDQVPAEVLEKEKEIIRAQPDMEGKPAEIVEKMLGGRINKYLKEVSLLDQPFVKDPNTSVGALVKGAGAEIVAFERLVVGEGIEKEEVDFAAEVQAAAKG